MGDLELEYELDASCAVQLEEIVELGIHREKAMEGVGNNGENADQHAHDDPCSEVVAEPRCDQRHDCENRRDLDNDGIWVERALNPLRLAHCERNHGADNEG